MRLGAPDPGGMSLGEDEVHVWYAWTDRCLAEGRSEFYRGLLTADERARMERFAFDYLKREFLVTRALCRLTLSRYADVDPRTWRFEANRYGRPEISHPQLSVPMRFNLSNARSLIACVVTAGVDAGVDVEETDRGGETVSIADRYFSPSEVRALLALPPAQQPTRFFEYWTLKESYIKARGMGLSLPLEQFSFELDAERIGIGFDPRLNDRPERWQFALFRPSPRHLLAVGVRRPGQSDLPIVIREVVPALAPAAGAPR